MKIQVNKIYKYPKTNVIVYVTEVFKNDFSGYGFDWEGEFLYMAKDWTAGNLNGWIEADPKEWEERLSKIESL
jgi:hypothetical protein